MEKITVDEMRKNALDLLDYLEKTGLSIPDALAVLTYSVGLIIGMVSRDENGLEKGLDLAGMLATAAAAESFGKKPKNVVNTDGPVMKM